MKYNLQMALAFVIGTVLACIGNFVLQIILLFTDIVTRMQSSSLMVIVLWVVTGVFGAFFTVGAAESMTGRRADLYKRAGNAVLIISLVAILFAIFYLNRGLFRRDPKEFSLLFSNGYVFIAYFAGAALTSLLLRKLDE